MEIHKAVIKEFIETVWNGKQMDKLENFLTEDYFDHSVPIGFENSREGTRKWIEGTSASFEHQTLVDDIIGEQDKVCVRITMMLKHIGTWRGHLPTAKHIKTNGYRFFRLENGKIAEHWALIDGNQIEETIAGVAHGCLVK